MWVLLTLATVPCLGGGLVHILQSSVLTIVAGSFPASAPQRCLSSGHFYVLKICIPADADCIQLFFRGRIKRRCKLWFRILSRPCSHMHLNNSCLIKQRNRGPLMFCTLTQATQPVTGAYSIYMCLLEIFYNTLEVIKAFWSWRNPIKSVTSGVGL